MYRKKVNRNPQLQLFLTGKFHDCIFRVGCAPYYKDFKCHKLTLSKASVELKKMFFRRAKMDPAVPIPLKNVEPPIFLNAMKYIYGSVTDFGDIHAQAKLYRFAYRMRIESLVVELDEQFMNVKPDDVFKIYELYQDLCKGKLVHLKKILEEETVAAVKSAHWVRMRSGSVLEVLRMEALKASEAELLEAVLRWGAFQQGQQGDQRLHPDHPDYPDTLRNKVAASLRSIRFGAIKSSEGKSRVVPTPGTTPPPLHLRQLPEEDALRMDLVAGTVFFQNRANTLAFDHEEFHN